MWPRRWPGFGITRDGKIILEYKSRRGIDTGIEFDSLPGLISPYIEYEAACRAGYRFPDEWRALSGDDKAMLVAAYLLHDSIEMNKEDAQAEATLKK